MDSEYYSIQTKNVFLSRNAVINILIGIFLVCNVFCAESPVSGCCSIICMGVFFWFLFQNHPILYLKYLHFIFGSVAAIFGCASIEYFNIELIEIDEVSSFHGSLPLLVLSWWAFMITLSVHDKHLSEKLSAKQNQNIVSVVDSFSTSGKREYSLLLYLIVVTGCIFTAFSFVMVMDNPSFSVGVDRFDYSNMFDYGFLYSQALRFCKYLIIPCIVVAIYKHSIAGWIGLMFYCLHELWIGSKFGAFFSLLCLFSMIFSERFINKPQEAKKIIAILLSVIIALVGVAVFSVSFTRDEGSANYLLPRLAQQSQLWWRTYDKSNTYHINEFVDEIESIKKGDVEIKENVGAKYGIYKIMYYTTPKTRVDTKLNSGSRYTEAGFAAAYYYLGITGCLLFAVIGGILISIFVNYFLYFLRYNQYIRAFIHLRFYTNATVLMSMFIFFPYFNRTSILSYLILVFGSNKIFKYGNEQI